MNPVRWVLCSFVAAYCAYAQTAGGQTSQTQSNDPFAGVAPAATPQDSNGEPAHSWLGNFFSDNFGFRGELMSLFDSDLDGSGASRQSIGFEALKKFSSETSTIASFDFQARLVRRDGYNPIPSDMEGAGNPGWSFEVHNLYLDLYNVFNPLMGDGARRKQIGRFNVRIGHFYVPFGLNLQTDTHATLLQLSNGDNFGFDEDWVAGFWGAINKHLHYDVYYLAGSGHDLKFKGQKGLVAARISLSNRYTSQYGLEGGLSVIGGDRLASAAGAAPMTGALAPLRTERIGIDGRYRHTAPNGSLAFTTELSGGRDAFDPVVMELHQAEYLRSSRRWGIGSQFRRFYRDGGGTTASATAEFTWYFRNDVAGSNLHWIKLNIERQLESVGVPPHTILTLQYYLYR
jgi:hypothetical protein